jgi:hypothetical protein
VYTGTVGECVGVETLPDTYNVLTDFLVRHERFCGGRLPLPANHDYEVMHGAKCPRAPKTEQTDMMCRGFCSIKL